MDAASQLRLEVWDTTESNLLCSGSYADRFIDIDVLNHEPDFDTETFQSSPYGYVSCDTYMDGAGTALINGDSYVVKVMDDNGTLEISGDVAPILNLVGTAEVASPVLLPNVEAMPTSSMVPILCAVKR